MGDAEAIEFAIEIHGFMKSNGFLMKEPDGVSQGVFTGPVKGIALQTRGDEFTFVVGTNIP